MKASMPAGVEVATGISGSWCVLHKNGSLQPGSNGTYIDARKMHGRYGQTYTLAEVISSGHVITEQILSDEEAPEKLVLLAKEYLQ